MDLFFESLVTIFIIWIIVTVIRHK